MKLRVASFNIRNGDADDGPNSWEFRREAAVQCIRSLDASIVGLQEVMKYQLDFILDGLPDYGYVGVGRLDGLEEGEYAPILYRKGELQPVDSGWFWLSETPDVPGSKSWDTACERMCTWAVFRGFTGFNTHLDHVSEEARRRGLELILSRASAPAIILGDFNAGPDAAPIRSAIACGFQDAGAGLDEATFHDWGTVDGGRIDYILARGARLSGYRTETALMNRRLPSDHFPISAWVEL